MSRVIGVCVYLSTHPSSSCPDQSRGSRRRECTCQKSGSATRARSFVLAFPAENGNCSEFAAIGNLPTRRQGSCKRRRRETINHPVFPDVERTPWIAGNTSTEIRDIRPANLHSLHRLDSRGADSGRVARKAGTRAHVTSAAFEELCVQSVA